MVQYNNKQGPNVQSSEDLDKELLNYFGQEIIDQLDLVEKNNLLEEFSRSELRNLGQSDIQTIKMQSARSRAQEYSRRLSLIHTEEYPKLKSWYLDQCNKVEEIHCLGKNHGDSSLIGLVAYHKLYKSNTDQTYMHPEGAFIVSVGGVELLSSRARLDNLMGFQCLCTNNTLWAKVEVDNISKEHRMKSLTSEDRIAVKQAIDRDGYKADTTFSDNAIRIESFELRRVAA